MKEITITIREGATNGEVLKMLFPSIYDDIDLPYSWYDVPYCSKGEPVVTCLLKADNE